MGRQYWGTACRHGGGEAGRGRYWRGWARHGACGLTRRQLPLRHHNLHFNVAGRDRGSSRPRAPWCRRVHHLRAQRLHEATG